MVDLDFDGSGIFMVSLCCIHGIPFQTPWVFVGIWSQKKHTNTKHQTSGPHSGKPPGFLEWQPGDLAGAKTCVTPDALQKNVQGGKPLNMFASETEQKYVKNTWFSSTWLFFYLKRMTYRNLEIRCVSTTQVMFLMVVYVDLIDSSHVFLKDGFWTLRVGRHIHTYLGKMIQFDVHIFQMGW